MVLEGPLPGAAVGVPFLSRHPYLQSQETHRSAFRSKCFSTLGLTIAPKHIVPLLKKARELMVCPGLVNLPAKGPGQSTQSSHSKPLSALESVGKNKSLVAP